MGLKTEEVMVVHKLLTVRDVSKELGMRPMTIYRFVQQGLLQT